MLKLGRSRRLFFFLGDLRYEDMEMCIGFSVTAE